MKCNRLSDWKFERTVRVRFSVRGFWNSILLSFIKSPGKNILKNICKACKKKEIMIIIDAEYLRCNILFNLKHYLIENFVQIKFNKSVEVIRFVDKLARTIYNPVFRRSSFVFNVTRQNFYLIDFWSSWEGDLKRFYSATRGQQIHQNEISWVHGKTFEAICCWIH